MYEINLFQKAIATYAKTRNSKSRQHVNYIEYCPTKKKQKKKHKHLPDLKITQVCLTRKPFRHTSKPFRHKSKPFRHTSKPIRHTESADSSHVTKRLFWERRFVTCDERVKCDETSGIR